MNVKEETRKIKLPTDGDLEESDRHTIPIRPMLMSMERERETRQRESNELNFVVSSSSAKN